jgi:hypothetical protein
VEVRPKVNQLAEEYDFRYDHTREKAMKRVTVTLPDTIVEEIDRWEKNRSKFVLEAAERELDLRRRRELERSLRSPHPESSQVAEAGIEEWGEGWTADDENLVDPSAGRSVRWTPDGGWCEESE